MRSLNLNITLETELVLSSSSATVGAHTSVQRIRGSALLGACAAQGYASPHSFDLFHSGRMRYGDALPAAGPSVALPMPLALHAEKGAARGGPCWNLAVDDGPRSAQLEQVRHGFIGPDGQNVQVATTYTMRTAVDDGGQARGGFLFGLETVSAGQIFCATIQADTEELLAEVERRLVGRVHRIGRSRSAEFGLARVEQAEFDPWPVISGCVDTVRILCISDLALRDPANGAPRLLPTGEDFGMPGAEMDLARSFIRSARYSPYNAFRRRHDLERQVIVAGSVLVFRAAPTDLDELRARLAGGVGEYRLDGLGRVLVQPALLESSQVALHGAESTPSSESQTIPLPADELGRWIGARILDERRHDAAWSLSREWAEKMKGYRGVPSAQWGELRRLAAQARVTGRGKAHMLAELRQRLGLEANVETGHSKHRTKGRSATANRWSAKRGGQTAAECLVKLIEQAGESEAVSAVEQLGIRMVRVLRQEDHDERP